MIDAKNFWFWFGGIWFGVGVVFLCVGIGVGLYDRSLDARFAAEGRTVEGVVLAKEISSSNDSSAYRVTFRFDDRGTSIRGAAELEPEDWDALTERGPIEISYLPERPQTYRVAGERDDDFVVTLAMSSVGAVLTVVGGYLLLMAIRRRNLEKKLALDGIAAVATVLEAAPGNLRINGIPQWKLRYRFRDFEGHEHDGAYTLAAHEAQAWKPGQSGRVRYDTLNPRRHIWLGQD